MSVAPPTMPQSVVGKNNPEGLPPRCIRCAYVLTGLHAGRCPECGLPFNLAIAGTFTIKPPLIGWKFWLPGMLLSVGGGLAVMALLIVGGNWGWALWLGLPFSAGSLLGYRVRSGVFMLVLLGIMLVVSLFMGLAFVNLAGVFCGFALAAIFVGPVLIGTLFGTLLRMVLKATDFSQRWHLPVWLLLITPLILGLIEGGPGARQPTEHVTTSMMLPADSQRTFDAIMYYEDVTHPPPWILRVGLAHPLTTHGTSQRVGDVKTCIYNKGRITKRVIEIEHGRRLAFEVIEQSIGYERDVRLTGGAFDFEPQADGSTKVTLTTTYEPLLHPRWCWRPFERYAMHTLHEHVIEGMRRRAQGIDPADDRYSTDDADAAVPVAVLGGDDVG